MEKMRVFQHKNLIFLVAVTLAGVLLLWSLFYTPPVSSENLQHFYDLTKNDPLFYDPATDAEFLRKTVAVLKKKEEIFLSVNEQFLPAEWKSVYPDGWRLWPIEFLALLPAIHEVTEALLENQTAESAVRLVELHESTARAYKKSIDMHKEALYNFLRIEPDRLRRRFRYIKTATTPEIVLSDFALIQKNADALEKEIKQRKFCLFYGRCPKARINSPSNQTDGGARQVELRALPSEILAQDDRFGVFKELAGPYWAATPCLGRAEDGNMLAQPFFVNLSESEGSGRTILTLVFANDMFYRDLAAVEPSKFYAAARLNYGISYNTQRPSAYYMCSDLTYYPEVLAAYFKDVEELDSLSEKNKIFTLPYFIDFLSAHSNTRLIYRSIYSKKSLDPSYLVLNLSAYSLLFGSFSPAIWRINEQPQYTLRYNIDLQPSLLSYNDLLERGLSFDEILAIHSQKDRDEEIYQRFINEELGNE